MPMKEKQFSTFSNITNIFKKSKENDFNNNNRGKERLPSRIDKMSFTLINPFLSGLSGPQFNSSKLSLHQIRRCLDAEKLLCLIKNAPYYNFFK